jgi:hypothetical protein
MQILKRAALLSAAAMAIGATPALSQNISYTTTGAFTGTGCSGTTCTEGVYTLSYVGNPGPTNYLSGSQVDLGSFSIGCGSNTCSSFTLPGGISFMLTITQTSPSGGTGTFTGTVAGTVQANPDFSSLFWTPTTTTMSIGNVQYRLVTDAINVGQILIPGPTGAPGANNPNVTQVKALVTVPEPSTVALMATGFVGLVPVFRRRRR